MTDASAERRERVAAWFAELRDRICRAFEAIEAEHDGPSGDRPPGRFERTTWRRPAGAPAAAARRSHPSASLRQVVLGKDDFTAFHGHFNDDIHEISAVDLVQNFRKDLVQITEAKLRYDYNQTGVKFNPPMFLPEINSIIRDKGPVAIEDQVDKIPIRAAAPAKPSNVLGFVSSLVAHRNEAG